MWVSLWVTLTNLCVYPLPPRSQVAEAAELAKRMLGGTLVTKQTGPGGKPVNTLLVAKKMKLGAEKYFALLLDRKSAGPVAIACSQGGTSIEELAEAYPDRIVRVPIDPLVGMTDSQAKTIVDALQTSADKADAAALIKSLYKLFSTRDVTLLEVNPLAECEGMLMCADTKLNFDDNAAFRQKDVFAQRDSSQEDPREVAAAKYDLNFIALDGNIGCMVNGAGLAMATMDIIKMAGGSPANFLDVGGSANESQIENAFRILVSDPKVKCVLVNIFGGIMKCDVIANGIVAAAKSLQLKVPLVVRLEGTNVAEGKRILETSGMKIIAAEDLDDAARKAVASIRGK